MFASVDPGETGRFMVFRATPRMRSFARDPSSDLAPAELNFGAAVAETPRSEPSENFGLETADLTRQNVADLSRDPQVIGLVPSIPTKLMMPLDATANSTQAAALAGSSTWGIAEIGAASSAFDGTGTSVAVLDTGIDKSHPAFNGVHLEMRDFTTDPETQGSAPDGNGHGTHCAGTIFGRSVGGTRIGVAPGVTTALIGKVLTDSGSGTSEMLFRGMNWALTSKPQVLSMSIGFDFPGLVQRLVTMQKLRLEVATSVALEAYRANVRAFDAIMSLAKALEAFGSGTIVCAATGNESDRPNFTIALSIPAAAEGVVAVGAVGRGAAPGNLTMAKFSNTMPAVCAPGVDVLSVWPGGGTRTLQGTSMATPHVAGIAALYWQKMRSTNQNVKASAVMANLIGASKASGISGGANSADFGSGLVIAP